MGRGSYTGYQYVKIYDPPSFLKLCACLASLSVHNYAVLQGTGSAGATVRIYIEQFEPNASKHDEDAQVALKPLIGWFTVLFFCHILYFDSENIFSHTLLAVA